MGSLQATFAFLDLVKQGQMKKVVFISSGMGDTGKFSRSADLIKLS